MKGDNQQHVSYWPALYFAQLRSIYHLQLTMFTSQLLIEYFTIRTALLFAVIGQQ